MTNEIWILGATGRTGGDVAERLDAAGVSLVLAGRSGERLERLRSRLGGGHRIVVGSLAENLAALEASGAGAAPGAASRAGAAPAVVVNTVGPFSGTGARVARACPCGTHYVDIANEFAGVDDILRLDRQAAAAGQVLVTGAGFGVLGTESALLRTIEGMPRPQSVRVDALPALSIEKGKVGAALAGSIVEVLRFGGREVRGGRLVRSANAAHPERLRTPDGDELSTGGGANGELLAAWRASGADTVVAASMAAPTGVLLRRVALPLLSIAVRMPGVAGILNRAVSRITLPAAPMKRRSSWGHARVEWSSGEVRDGWMRVGDGGGFTADVMAEVALRLLRGEGRPGAHTPGALFGAELAESLGCTFTLAHRGDGAGMAAAAPAAAAPAPASAAPAPPAPAASAAPAPAPGEAPNSPAAAA